MTDLHNMSVPPRTVLTVQRAALTGQRYRLDLATFIAYQADPTDHEGITRRIRTDGADCKEAGKRLAGTVFAVGWPP